MNIVSHCGGNMLLFIKKVRKTKTVKITVLYNGAWGWAHDIKREVEKTVREGCLHYYDVLREISW